MHTNPISLAIGLLAVTSLAAPSQAAPLQQQDGAGKLVAAHFMVGIMSNRNSAADYDNDMKKAKAAGIDAFALNIAKDDYTDTQLNYAYESAANNDMKVFISFDYNYFATDENVAVGAKLKTYCAKSGQLKINNKCFVSSFNGDNDPAKLFDAKTIRAAAGVDLYLVPNLSPHNTATAASTVEDIDGAFSWAAWDSNGQNRAPSNGINITTSNQDSAYTTWLGDKPYMAPVSPWFFTNLPSKAWTFPSDLLWFTRWNQILALAPPMLEILIWNDFGESHYIGADPDTDTHTDDGSSAYTAHMPHAGWLDVAKPYIAAFKAGEKKPIIAAEKLVYWYRPSPKAACGPFDGISTLSDSVFVVALLKSPADITVTSGRNSKTFSAPAGASAYQVDMAVGKQTFRLARAGAEIAAAAGALEVADACGPVNLNAFVGALEV